MRIIVCTLALMLAACAKKGTKPPDIVEPASMPASCVLMGSLMHDFRSYPPQMARQYSCSVPEFADMDCYFYATDDNKRELECLAGTPTQLQSTMPDSCTPLGDGVRFFFDGADTTLGVRPFTASNLLGSHAYNCGAIYRLSCFFYEHMGDGTDANTWQDLQCD